LLEDYGKLVENEFWHRFLMFIKEMSEDAMRQCATESYNDQKIRYWQGAFKALEPVYREYPERLYEQIKDEIEG